MTTEEVTNSRTRAELEAAARRQAEIVVGNFFSPAEITHVELYDQEARRVTVVILTDGLSGNDVGKMTSLQWGVVLSPTSVGGVNKIRVTACVRI